MFKNIVIAIAKNEIALYQQKNSMQKNGYSIIQFQAMAEYRYGNVSKCILPADIPYMKKKQQLTLGRGTRGLRKERD